MIKFIALLGGLIVCSSALAVTESDQYLLDHGIVDENFVYQDLEAAGAYFRSIADGYAVSLPQKVSSELEWVSNVVTPYNSVATYKYNFETDDEYTNMTREAAIEPSFVHETCKTYYIDEFLRANNYQVTYVYVDANYKHIYNVKMSKDICKKAKVAVIAADIFN